MYQIVFYEDVNGVSDLWDFLDDLLQRSSSNKDARIQHKQIVYYIDLLQNNGTRLPETVTKNIADDIWELRPGDNRVFYFFFQDNTFVLLHHFRKKSQKTPQREINRAIAERDDYLSRKGGGKT
jgi:phage-related protein